MNDRLSGKTVLVTGAGAGIGRAVSIAAAEAGAHVIVTSLSDNGGQTLKEIESRGGQGTWVVCDVTERAAVDHAVAEAVRITGRLDAMIHNALSRPEWDDPRTQIMAELPLELWEHQARVALRGAYYCGSAAYPHLRKTKGRLILLTSASGLEGTPSHAAYAGCKGALRGMTKSLAREWGPEGITVNAVSPFVTTPAFKSWWDRNPGSEEATTRLTALHHLGDPEEDVAPVFVFLLSDDSHYMTGQTFCVDAGRYLAL